MIESQYTKKVNSGIPKHIFCWKISDQFFGGVPDSYYNDKTNYNGCLWVEYKFIKELPKRPETVVVPDLSKLQDKCLDDLASCGDQVIVIVGVERNIHQRFASVFVLTREEFNTGIPAKVAQERLLDYAGIRKIIMGYL